MEGCAVEFAWIVRTGDVVCVELTCDDLELTFDEFAVALVIDVPDAAILVIDELK